MTGNEFVGKALNQAHETSFMSPGSGIITTEVIKQNSAALAMAFDFVRGVLPEIDRSIRRTLIDLSRSNAQR